MYVCIHGMPYALMYVDEYFIYKCVWCFGATKKCKLMQQCNHQYSIQVLKYSSISSSSIIRYIKI